MPPLKLFIVTCFITSTVMLPRAPASASVITAQAFAQSWDGDYDAGPVSASNPIVAQAFARVEAQDLAHNYFVFGSAAAYGDIRTGIIGAGSATDGITSGAASVSLAEFLIYNIEGANENTITPVRYALAIDGALSASGTSAAQMTYITQFSQSDSRGMAIAPNAIYSFWGEASGTEGVTVNRFSSGFAYESFFRENESDKGIFTYNLIGKNPRVDVEKLLRVSSTGTASAAYQHTASFVMILPSHVTFAAGSGVFLSQVPGGSVPEPSSIIMLLSGLSLTQFATKSSAKIRKAKVPCPPPLGK